MRRNYLKLLLVSAVLIAPACTKENKARLMAGAVVSGCAGVVHFFGNKLGIRRHRQAAGVGAEARSNVGPVFTKSTVPLKARSKAIAPTKVAVRKLRVTKIRVSK